MNICFLVGRFCYKGGGSHHKIGLVLGVISMYLGPFLNLKVQNARLPNDPMINTWLYIKTIAPGFQPTFLKYIRTQKISVGRCVIPCAFFGKSVKHTFSCKEMYPV